MTIPTLVSKIQEAHFHAKWKECYAILNNAVKMAAANNPSMLVSPEPSGPYGVGGPRREFIDSVLSNLSVLETCGNALHNGVYDTSSCENCPWADVNIDSNGIYKTLAGNRLSGYDFGLKAAFLKNGATVYFGGVFSGLIIAVDVNSASTAPNVLGKDFYAISLSISSNSNLKIEELDFKPMGAEGTRTEKAGYAGCDESIGANPDANGTINALFEAPGAGCSYKYLYEK